MSLVKMTCTEQQQGECPYNDQHGDCGGSCSLQEGLAERLYWYEKPTNKEAKNMPEEEIKTVQPESGEEEITGGQFWNPEKGEQVKGKLIATREGKYGPIWDLQKDDGEVITTPSAKVLQNRLSACEIGDTVRIVYTHDELPTVKGNNPTKMFQVFRSK